MSVTRTFTVTVVSTGSGNKYAIDGVQQATVQLGEGYTYRFDQSDSSNGTGGGHPLRFSTTSDGTHGGGGSEYTVGVTTNGTPGSAGAYTQIQVAFSAPQLYYYCSNHPNMGGEADTPAGDTWGLNAWGNNQWGNQDQNKAIVTTAGSLSTSVGSVTTDEEINTGWGRLTWGENSWGAAGDVVAVGQSLTTSPGSVTARAGASGAPSGNVATLSAGTSTSFDIGATVQVTTAGLLNATAASPQSVGGDGSFQISSGVSASTSVGSVEIDARIGEGWGRRTWGNLVWGGNFSTEVTGISMTASIGTLQSVFTDVTVGVTGAGLLTSTIGLESIQIDNSVFVFAFEPDMTLSLGSQSLVQSTIEPVTGQALNTSINSVLPEPILEVDVSGISASLNLGSISLVQGTTEPVTGQALAASVNSVIDFVAYPVTGSAASTSVGSVTAVGTAGTSVTGIGLTTNIGTVNITSWNEIDTGVNNTWTEVDLAA